MRALLRPLNYLQTDRDTILHCKPGASQPTSKGIPFLAFGLGGHTAGSTVVLLHDVSSLSLNILHTFDVLLISATHIP